MYPRVGMHVCYAVVVANYHIIVVSNNIDSSRRLARSLGLFVRCLVDPLGGLAESAALDQ